jgi:hypothetical protein
MESSDLSGAYLPESRPSFNGMEGKRYRDLHFLRGYLLRPQFSRRIDRCHSWRSLRSKREGALSSKRADTAVTIDEGTPSRPHGQTVRSLGVIGKKIGTWKIRLEKDLIFEPFYVNITPGFV